MNTEDYEEEMRGAGVDYILKKPVLQSQVYSLISEICSVPEAEKNKTEDYDFTGKRALLAEDNAVNAEVFQGFSEGSQRRSRMCRQWGSGTFTLSEYAGLLL